MKCSPACRCGKHCRGARHGKKLIACTDQHRARISASIRATHAAKRCSGRPVNGQAAKTKCAYGHLFTRENTIICKNGWRHCRTCKTKYDRDWRERSKVKNAA